VNRDSRRLRLVLALLLVTSVTLLTLDLRAGRSGAFGALRTVVAAALGPLQSGVGAGTAPIGRAIGAAVHSGRDSARIADLERQNGDLRRQLAADAQGRSDAEFLRRIGYLTFRGRYDIVGAAVAGVGGPVGGGEQTLTLDVGTGDGVREKMAVISADGLVGEVVRSFPSTCLVRLLTDRTFTVGAQLERPVGPPVFATVSGQGPGRPLLLSYADSTRPLAPGTRLVTYRATVPQGIPIGTVTDVDNQVGAVEQTASVRPLADLAGLDVLGVVRTEPRTTARPGLPALPPPAPGP